MSNGHIYAFLTCTRVRWEEDAEGNPIEEPVEDHGWVDRSWSPYVLHESRNDVRPEVDEPEDSEDLADTVREALGRLGAYEDNGDGTFYGQDDDKPFHDNPEGWRYSYALHFTRKGGASEGYAERPWHPVNDGGITL